MNRKFQRFERFSFCPGEYKDNGKYYNGDVNYSDMYDDIREILRIGIKNGYHFHVHSDGYCVMLDYDYDNPELAEYSLEWVGEDEYVTGYADAHEYATEIDGEPGVHKE